MAYCWPFSSHNCHRRKISESRFIFSTELLLYRSAIYPQWKTFRYGLGGRLGIGGDGLTLFAHVYTCTHGLIWSNLEHYSVIAVINIWKIFEEEIFNLSRTTTFSQIFFNISVWGQDILEHVKPCKRINLSMSVSTHIDLTIMVISSPMFWKVSERKMYFGTQPKGLLQVLNTFLLYFDVIFKSSIGKNSSRTTLDMNEYKSLQS